MIGGSITFHNIGENVYVELNELDIHTSGMSNFKSWTGAKKMAKNVVGATSRYKKVYLVVSETEGGNGLLQFLVPKEPDAPVPLESDNIAKESSFTKIDKVYMTSTNRTLVVDGYVNGVELNSPLDYIVFGSDTECKGLHDLVNKLLQIIEMRKLHVSRIKEIITEAGHNLPEILRKLNKYSVAPAATSSTQSTGDPLSSGMGWMGQQIAQTGKKVVGLGTGFFSGQDTAGSQAAASSRATARGAAATARNQAVQNVLATEALAEQTAQMNQNAADFAAAASQLRKQKQQQASWLGSIGS